MADEHDDKHDTEIKQEPEPGSPADLFPDATPQRVDDEDIVEKGEPLGGANFA